MRGRFAPSPTGPLHLGSLATAIVAEGRARQSGGEFLLRFDDLDRPRVVPGAAETQLRQLSEMSIAWDGEPLYQSARLARYEAIVRAWKAEGALYFCDCSRAEIAKMASAPHEGEEGPLYPGLCRDRKDTNFRRAPALRFRAPSSSFGFIDAKEGPQAGLTDDLLVVRGDGTFSYQFACAVDDFDLGVTEVVRGRDLRSSAAKQAMLIDRLGGTAPSYLHVPLLVEEGRRLAKREGDGLLGELLSAGISARALKAVLAEAYGGVARGERYEFACERLPVADVEQSLILGALGVPRRE